MKKGDRTRKCSVRRPLLYIVFAFAAPVAAGYYCGLKVLILTAAACMLMLALSSRKWRLPAALCMVIISYLAGTANFVMYDIVRGAPVLQDGEVYEMTGKTVQISQKEMSDGTCRHQYRIRIYRPGGNIISSRDVLAVRYSENADDGMVPGDIIKVKGTAERPSPGRNPGCFDYSLYLRSVGINDVIKADSVEVLDGKGMHTVAGRLYVFRETFLSKLEQKAGHDASSMMGAILFGEKDEMDEDVLEEFRKNGTAHVLAVSGLHIGIIYAVISKLWRWGKGRLYFAATMTFFCCYAVLASFSPSVTRAVFMIGLHQFAILTNRRYDLYSAAFCTAAVMMMRNPMCIFNTGFQMSFLAVLTMMMVMPAAEKIYKGIFTASLSVQAGLMPYVAYVFNYLSPGAVLVNVPVIFLTGIIVPMGLCAMVFSVSSDGLFSVVSAAAAGLCRMMTVLNHVSAADGVTVFEVTSPGKGTLAFYYMSLTVFLSEEGRLAIKRRGGKKFIPLMLSAVLLVSFSLGEICGSGFEKADLTFVDVGQGDCIHFRTEDGGNYFVDGGGSINYNVGKKVLKPYLLKNGVKKLDGAFVTHLHTDHYKGIAELCREGMIKRLYLYEGNRPREEEILRETGLEPEALTYLYKGQTVQLSAETSVRVLWPERKTAREYEKLLQQEEDENQSSLIMKICMRDVSVIATGDVDADCLQKIGEAWRSDICCDILKVAHHGSRYSYSGEFMEQAAPSYAVFQVGKNNFGHPDNGVIENYRQNGIMVYRNDKDGAVGFDFSDDGKAEVMTMLRQ